VFYTFVWQQLFGNPLTAVIPATFSPLIASIKLALHNWKRVWDEVKSSFSSDELSAMGFQNSAESYWLITRFVIYSYENKGAKTFLLAKSDVAETGAHLKPGVSWIQP
jgi:hypothetical protein